VIPSPISGATEGTSGVEIESSTPVDKYPALREHFTKLERLRDAHAMMFQTMWTAGAGIYTTDFVMVGILKRSMDLADAILTLTRSWNYTAAAPLLRLQLDNLLRVYYIAKLNDPTQFIAAVLKGERLNKLKDAEGQPLTDRRLRELAQRQYPWLDRVYEETSELVHFSGRHCYVTVTGMDDTSRTVEHFIGVGLPHWPENAIAEFLDATAHATDALLRAMAGWVVWKQDVSENHKARLRELGLLKEKPV
jgi:hypothetical protein